MDPHGNIYEGDPALIPVEDKARLDGYLRGRAEENVIAGFFADRLAAYEAAQKEVEAKIRELEAHAKSEEDGLGG